MQNLIKILERLKVIEPRLYNECRNKLPKRIWDTKDGVVEQLELALQINPSAVERAIRNADYPVDMQRLGYSAVNFFYRSSMKQVNGCFGARGPNYTVISN